MPFFYQAHLLLLSIFLPSCTFAAPSRVSKHSFTVERIRNPNFQRYNGPKELWKTYQKYRMQAPPGLADFFGHQTGDSLLFDVAVEQVNGNSDAGVGLVPATPANNGIEYISPVTIGGQTINVALDSGSADLWVFSTELLAASVTGHQTYNPSLSPSFRVVPGANFSILYGDGTSAEGIVGTDTVDVGGATVTGQAVQLATAISPAFAEDTNLSGLLGLAFSQLSTVKPVKQRTFFENVMPTLAEPLFTADLRKDAVGAYEFGRIDASKFVGDLSWVPVDTSKGFWQVSTLGFCVGGNQTRLPASNAIVDTGTTIMLVSKEVVDGYYSQIPGAKRTAAAGGMTFPCNATLPDLVLDVGGVYAAKIKGADINFGQFKGDGTFSLPLAKRRVILILRRMLWRHPAHQL